MARRERAAAVFLVDDQALISAGLTAVLQAQPDVEVVGEAATGEDALMTLRRVRAEVVLVDLQLGAGIDGTETTRRILGRGGAAGPRP